MTTDEALLTLQLDGMERLAEAHDVLAAEVRRYREMRCDGCRYYDDMERAAFTLPFCRKWSSDGPQPNTVFCMDIKGCLAWEGRDE